MDLLIWNCRGALKPTFCNIITDLVRNHSPAIMILIETKACGDRAKKIANKLPFDGAIFANTIGLSGGIWLLWDSSQVVVVELSSTEQEIHVAVTPNHQDGSWLLSAVYTSPRFAKRWLLWENLASIAGLHFYLGLWQAILMKSLWEKMNMGVGRSRLAAPFSFKNVWTLVG